ncbi:MAG: potassium-transporting ATPase subunit B, partial [Anaerolineae bacterium]
MSDIFEAFLKLDPRQQVRNPVMFVVTVGSVLTTVLFIRALLGGNNESSAITGLVTGWLWFTVLFSNFAEALAGGHIQIRAEALRRMHRQVMAKKLHRPEGKDDYEIVPAASLRRGDVVLVEAGETIPADGEVVEGCAPVDESALSGKSAPIAREAGGDHSAVTGGTCVLSDWL